MSDKKEKPENPQAFPRGVTHDSIYGGRVHGESGMTLRDYTEIRAMQALITVNYIKNEDDLYDVRYDYDELAIQAKYYADAMLKERNK